MTLENVIIIARFILCLILMFIMMYYAGKRNTSKVVFFGIFYLAISLEGKVNLITQHLNKIINLLK